MGDRERLCSPVRGGEVTTPLGTQGDETSGFEFRMRSLRACEEGMKWKGLVWTRIRQAAALGVSCGGLGDGPLGTQPAGSCSSKDKQKLEFGQEKKEDVEVVGSLWLQIHCVAVSETGGVFKSYNLEKKRRKNCRD